MPALPLRRSGRSVCPARPAGLARVGSKAKRMRSARRLARRPSRISHPAKSGSGASPLSLTVIRRARPSARVRIPSDSRSPSMSLLHIRLAAGALAGAFAALWLRPPTSRRLRRPYLPGHARHRRSWRSGRAHAAGRQLCSLQFRRRPRVGRELRLDQDDHPGPQRGDQRRTDLGAPGRLRLERARHRAAVAGVVPPRRGVHVQGWLRHILGRNRHGNPGGFRRAKHLLSTGGRGSRLRNVAGVSQIPTPVRDHRRFSTTTPGQDWTNGNPNVSTFNWGFTLQYSLPYFNTHLAAIDNDFLKHRSQSPSSLFRPRFTMAARAGG